MMTDPIADMLTRIRNSVRVERPFVDLPVSNVKKNLAEVLKREGYIWGYEVVQQENSKSRRKGAMIPVLRIQLKYGPNGERVIRHIKRVSKPGRRIYAGAENLKPVLNGLGITILSTSHGLLSDREARLKNLGGEVLCEVW